MVALICWKVRKSYHTLAMNGGTWNFRIFIQTYMCYNSQTLYLYLLCGTWWPWFSKTFLKRFKDFNKWRNFKLLILIFTYVSVTCVIILNFHTFTYFVAQGGVEFLTYKEMTMLVSRQQIINSRFRIFIRLNILFRLSGIILTAFLLCSSV